MKKILLIGAGQIGSRHLQALAKLDLDQTIFVIDPSQVSLRRAADRLDEVDKNSANKLDVFFQTNYDAVPHGIDLAIVATSAQERLNAIKKVKSTLHVKSWILEKVLAQRSADLDQLSNLFKDHEHVWVNLPRRSVPWMQQIKSAFAFEQDTTITVKGTNWGLACNAVHFIDLALWLFGENSVQFDCPNLNPQWFEAKRDGYWEIQGTLTGQFSSGQKLILTSQQTENNEPNYVVEIADNEKTLVIDEDAGTAICSDGRAVNGSFPLQSEMTDKVAFSILKNGTSMLPTLETAIESHKPLLDALHLHWKTFGPFDTNYVPIT